MTLQVHQKPYVLVLGSSYRVFRHWADTNLKALKYQHNEGMIETEAHRFKYVFDPHMMRGYDRDTTFYMWIPDDAIIPSRYLAEALDVFEIRPLKELPADATM